MPVNLQLGEWMKDPQMNDASIRAKGLDYFRRTVAMLYREVGVLKPKNHPSLAKKAKLAEPFFADRKAQAKQLYKLSLTDRMLDLTLDRYEKRTGLSLKDVHDVFAEGTWGSPPSFGGPKWAEIAATAIDLGNALGEQRWGEVAELTQVVDSLEHNNGRLIDKFSQLDYGA